ncbi:FAD binding domain-containing protein [Mycolicibacterium rutilum]|uniref:FAD binding domain-containing protein n=1 Tax=Mycolicibacterium rutilum TaxID=370526 RepID=A0A1H6KZS0_MYCRU|nr:FAD-dependent oxidoreductase [Mycolicibacterium rutilum]SEH77287.1 FAD binding domain-containing protein [Mycolicibacterium rutilum]
MTQHFDVAIVGGGPAGSAAAWQAARTGASVVVLDKATFPRDKPCGDGLTPRAVSFLQKMGLADAVASFYRVSGARVFSPSEWNLAFPKRPGMPDHGHVVRRTALDALLLENAHAAGAEVRQGAEVIAPIVDDGRVIGVTLRGGERVVADAVIAADGAYSPVKRGLRLDSKYHGYSAIARSAPRCPSTALQAWRLPMGFTAWPPWRPGVLFAGDALGAARPVSGAGISKALQSGMAAGECAVAALVNGGPDDFTNYAQRVEADWGSEYRRGRFFHRLIGVPAVANAGIKVLDKVNHPGVRSHLLFWEGWGSAPDQPPNN